MRRSLAVGMAAALLTLGMGCSDDDAGDDDEAATTSTVVEPAVTIVIDDLAFDPEVVEIEAGETVRWEFADGDVEHQVQGATFESDAMSEGTFDHVFEDAGASTYLCAIHPEMTGRVNVSA